MKNNRGAISIEMIITVIVIIVLVGIAIFMLTGENGIFVPKDKENAVTTNELKEQNVTDNQNTVSNNETQEQNTTNDENILITVPVE